MQEVRPNEADFLHIVQKDGYFRQNNSREWFLLYICRILNELLIINTLEYNDRKFSS